MAPFHKIRDIAERSGGRFRVSEELLACGPLEPYADRETVEASYAVQNLFTLRKLENLFGFMAGQR